MRDLGGLLPHAFAQLGVTYEAADGALPLPVVVGQETARPLVDDRGVGSDRAGHRWDAERHVLDQLEEELVRGPCVPRHGHEADVEPSKILDLGIRVPLHSSVRGVGKTEVARADQDELCVLSVTQGLQGAADHLQVVNGAGATAPADTYGTVLAT